MKILIIGSSGLIGEALVGEFSKKHSVVGADIEPLDDKTAKIDMTDSAAVKSLLNDIKPKVILLPAADPNVDGCESNPLKSSKINVDSPKNISLLAKESGIKFVFFSSDYIFDGMDGPYAETSKPNPVSEYGRQKLISEEFIAENITDYLIIRTTVVYGPERRGKNFVLSLIKRLRNGEKVKVPYDQISTPTYSPNLAEAAVKLVESGAQGIFNIAGARLVNRMKFAESVCGAFNLDKTLIVPVTTAELNQMAKRPLNAGLKIEKLLSSVQVKMLGPEEGLLKLRSRLN